MAIKIGVDNTVKVFRPGGKHFTLQELNDEVGGLVEPQKVGPIWLMYNENKAELHNEIATLFFDTDLYGAVLVIPPQELPAEWEAMDDADYKYQAEDVDNGFLLSLQNVIKSHRIFGLTTKDDNLDRIKDFFQGQEEWLYTPPEAAEVDENTISFYQQVYDYISKHPDMFRKNILVSDPTLVIKLEQPGLKKKMIESMIEYFVSVEEFEKCAFLQNELKY
jgi:hypothetical protein